MKIIPHQNAASSVISVTNTATKVFDLIDTAGSLSDSRTYFLSPNNGGPANGISIRPEDGDIRVGIGFTPTASLGVLVEQDEKITFSNVANLEDLRIIRVGGTNVSCNIQVIKTQADAFFLGSSGGGSGVGIDKSFSLGSAEIQWDTADANANMLKLGFPAPSATEVPVFLIGIDSAIIDVDLGILNGTTEPKSVMTNSDASKWMGYGWNGVFFTFLGKDITNQILFSTPVNFATTYVIGANADQLFGSSAALGSNDTIGTPDMRLGMRNSRPFVICSSLNQDVALNAGTFSNPTVILTSGTGFGTATDERIEWSHDTTDFINRLQKGDYRYLYGYENDASINYRIAETDLTSVSGASVTATNLIPANANVIGVSTRVTTSLGTTNSTTGYTVGDGSDVDRWGALTGTDTTTHSDQADSTADPTGYFLTANNVVITATGGNFDGTGTIKIVVHYIDTTAPNAT